MSELTEQLVAEGDRQSELGMHRKTVGDGPYLMGKAAFEIERLSTEVREAFSDGFWVGCDAPAALPKDYVDKAFAERRQKPVSGTQENDDG